MRLKSALLVAASLTACAIVPSYQVELASERAFRVTYYDDPWDHTRATEAQAMASRHCAQYGKGASLQRSSPDANHRVDALFYCL